MCSIVCSVKLTYYFVLCLKKSCNFVLFVVRKIIFTAFQMELNHEQCVYFVDAHRKTRIRVDKRNYLSQLSHNQKRQGTTVSVQFVAMLLNTVFLSYAQVCFHLLLLFYLFFLNFFCSFGSLVHLEFLLCHTWATFVIITCFLYPVTSSS